MRILQTTLAALVVATLAGCQAAAERSGDDSTGAVPAGTPVEGKAITAMLGGNTIEEVTGRWQAYYAPDGRKVMKIGADVREVAWWVDGDGNFCEHRWAGETICGGTMYRDGDVVTATGRGRSGEVRFRVMPGNAAAL